MKKTIILITAALLLIALCSTAVMFNAAAAPKLSVTAKEIYVGSSFTLSVKNTSDNISWTSSDATIAKMYSSDAKTHSIKIKGMNEGTATITAKVGKTTLKCKVTVKVKKPPIKEYDMCCFKTKAMTSAEEKMNEMGKEGWEVKSTAVSDGYIYITFERTKEQE